MSEKIAIFDLVYHKESDMVGFVNDIENDVCEVIKKYVDEVEKFFIPRDDLIKITREEAQKYKGKQKLTKTIPSLPRGKRKITYSKGGKRQTIEESQLEAVCKREGWKMKAVMKCLSGEQKTHYKTTFRYSK